MKKILASITLTALILMNSGCATVFGGKITECQRTKPQAGQPQRQVRVAALVIDILCGIIPLAVDFGTHAIYKPCKNDNTAQKQSK